jgi:hypothetical protein
MIPSITGMPNTIPILDTPSLTKDESDPLCMKTAVKAFKDKHLIGLTDDEIREIRKRITAYLEEHSLETEMDMMAYKAFLEDLYREFGFKGSMDEFMEMFGIIDAGSSVDMAAHTQNQINKYYPPIPFIFDEK